MTHSGDRLVSDELWTAVGPPAATTPAALRRPTPHHQRSRLLCGDRLHGAHLYPWRLLPAKELGCGSPATARRRLNQWAKAGVFDQLR
jgi:hypothetical protein